MATQRQRISEATKPVDTRPEPPEEKKGEGRHMLRTLGLGVITGAADDDPSAIGTYASAGAAIGPAFLWTAPATFPMILLIMLMTNNRKIMGDRVNGRGLNILGWITTAAIFAATVGLVITWFM